MLKETHLRENKKPIKFLPQFRGRSFDHRKQVKQTKEEVLQPITEKSPRIFYESFTLVLLEHFIKKGVLSFNKNCLILTLVICCAFFCVDVLCLNATRTDLWRVRVLFSRAQPLGPPVSVTVA